MRIRHKHVVDWERASSNRSQRWSQYGRDMEMRVLQVLNRSGKFDGVTYHLPHSHEDCKGADFTVRRGNHEISFGVTISAQYLNDHRLKHPELTQLLMPLGIKDTTIVSKVERLFEH